MCCVEESSVTALCQCEVSAEGEGEGHKTGSDASKVKGFVYVETLQGHIDFQGFAHYQFL